MTKKDYSESSSIRQSGFIAQEVEKAAKESGYDFNGVHKPANENDNYSIGYSLFVVPLVKAVQEQQQIIDSLKLKDSGFRFQISGLEQENKNLKSEVEKLQTDVDKVKAYLELTTKK